MGAFNCVGGPSVFYGGVSLRFRSDDFAPAPEIVGDSGAAWPFDYSRARALVREGRARDRRGRGDGRRPHRAPAQRAASAAAGALCHPRRAGSGRRRGGSACTRSGYPWPSTTRGTRTAPPARPAAPATSSPVRSGRRTTSPPPCFRTSSRGGSCSADDRWRYACARGPAACARSNAWTATPADARGSRPRSSSWPPAPSLRPTSCSPRAWSARARRRAAVGRLPDAALERGRGRPLPAARRPRGAVPQAGGHPRLLLRAPGREGARRKAGWPAAARDPSPGAPEGASARGRGPTPSSPSCRGSPGSWSSPRTSRARENGVALAPTGHDRFGLPQLLVTHRYTARDRAAGRALVGAGPAAAAARGRLGHAGPGDPQLLARGGHPPDGDRPRGPRRWIPTAASGASRTSTSRTPASSPPRPRSTPASPSPPAPCAWGAARASRA